MTVILDAGGVSALATQRARLVELRRRGHLYDEDMWGIALLRREDE